MALVLVLLSLLAATAILMSGLRWPHAFVLGPVAIATGTAAVWLLFRTQRYDDEGSTIYPLSNMLPAYLIGGAILLGYAALQTWRRRRGNSPAGSVDTASGTQPGATWWRFIAAVTLITVPLGIAAATNGYQIGRYEPGGQSITITDDDWDF